MAKKPAPKKKSPARRPAAKRAATAPARSKKAAVRKSPARKTAPPARRAGKPPARAAARKSVTRTAQVRKAVLKKAVLKKAAPKKAVAKKTVSTPAARKKVVTRKVAVKKVAVKKAPLRKVAAGANTKAPAARKAAPALHVPALDRQRRTVAESTPSAPSSFVSNRHASAASSGADELRVRLASHTGTGPAITAGDVDANWEAAETVGDEAPGGDNPTPDQDVVDEIGRALGVEYDDDEELQGGDEIAARDHDRWELDPASSDDFDER